MPHHQARHGAEEDVVVDRRVILEELERQAKQEAFGRLEEGCGRARHRALAHRFRRVRRSGRRGRPAARLRHELARAGVKPADVVKAGEQLEVKILKINRETRKISLGLKQLSPDPWTLAVTEITPRAQRIKGKVVARAGFRRVRRTGAGHRRTDPRLRDVLEQEERPRRRTWSSRAKMVEVVVLGVNPTEKRIALGLKQALGDPWEEALEEVSGGHGGGSARHQPGQVRRLRRSGRWHRRHDPHRRHHGTKSA